MLVGIFAFIIPQGRIGQRGRDKQRGEREMRRLTPRHFWRWEPCADRDLRQRLAPRVFARVNAVYGGERRA